MSTGLHKELAITEIHTTVSLEYANAAARTGDTTLTAADKGRVARQTDDDTLWMLQNETPTWIQIHDTGGGASVFGQDYQTEVSLARDTTTSTSYQDKVTLTTPALTGTYRIGWTSVIDHGSTNSSMNTRLYNVTDDAEVGVAEEFEPKDLSDRNHIGGFAEVVFTGSAKTFKIQYKAQSSTAGIQDARIEIWRVS